MTESGARAAFVRRFGGVAESSPWVAERAWAAAPADDPRALAAAFAAVVRTASTHEQLALIRAHPDLAGRAALAGDLSDDSTREQAFAGLDRLSADELARFTRLNDAYRTRFGFPFVICARRHTAASILEAYDRRLGNDADRERATAVEEIVAIMALRLDAVA